MPDPDHLDRIEGFVLRRQIVAITHQEQRDEPPGRAPFRQREVVLASSQRTLSEKELPVEIAVIARNLPES